ncbi:HEPN domain-containing protein [Thalassospira sp. TSL5-1]|uniref:HEPN domain-containing protein n=1 Tax=Thalassospira sp. TSL5-1 TaxID=1544451 RepID=UPI000938E1C4|nr:HEPN domain-containing protein [Thalassospira sp. TSL5-1]OKH88345.1 hypothetical protein LF95_17145 [Thalassospira sp. TSL5-1]
MKPIQYYEGVWSRCDQLQSLFLYLNSNTSSVVDLSDLLRAEWSMRVSALDLYVHELVAQNMLSIFQGNRAICDGFQRYKLKASTLLRIRGSVNAFEVDNAFDLDVREYLSALTFQRSNSIADGVRMISPIVLWDAVCQILGADGRSLKNMKQDIKSQLDLICDRRNKIVHEGDLNNTFPRGLRPVARGEVDFVKMHIDRIVRAIDSCV